MNERKESGSDRFRDWKAILNLQPVVSDRPLRVGGEYRLNRRTGAAELGEAVPPSLNPRILLLDLRIVDGPGGDWVPVEGAFAAEAGRYDSVTIRDPQDASVTIEVQEVH